MSRSNDEEMHLALAHSPEWAYSASGLELWQWRLEARQQAIASMVPPAEVDWLLQEFVGLDRLALRLETFRDRARVDLRLPLSGLSHLWQQRVQARVPVQYLAGSTPWRKFSLVVSPAVLIPRPETEGLVDLAAAATALNPELSHGHWADLGTGSGAIALGLADILPAAAIHAVDYSPTALDIARQNAQRLGFVEQIHFHQGSWLEPLDFLKGRLSGLVANPPYIPSDMLQELQPEVTQHEPHLALDGGADGLNCIRHLIAAAPDYLCSGGIWLIEMMAGQASTVMGLLQANSNYCRVQVHPDLAGIERFAIAYRR